jgi:hypothetical protein
MSPRKSGLAATDAPPVKRGLTQVDVADRLRQSTSWIRTLTTRRILTRGEDGTYPWPQVAEEFEAYQESLEEQQPAAGSDLEANRARKFLVDALLREDELAVRRGDLVPSEQVVDRIRKPLEAIDARLRTAVRRHSKAWAAKLKVSQAEAMAMMHPIIEDARADLRAVFEELEAEHARDQAAA